MGHSATVLVIDDEPSARETVAALLHADRYALKFACDGREAVEYLEQPPVDLVVCDVMMVDVDGFEVCRRIKAHPRWRYVPIILLTALDGQDDMVRGIEAGADEFLYKPVDRVLLRARVRAMLRVRQHYAQLQGPADVDALLRARREQLVDAARLSSRQREILDLLLLGRTHDDIGRALGISARTAKFHQSKILEKLGVESRLDLGRLFF